ncbi:MAG: rRNA maturation RNase YbeY [Patescibacteria group bacterium]|jgi:probable rRNA maturation factor
MQVELYKEVNSPVEEGQVVQLVKTALRALRKSNSISISVAIVSAKTGRALNKSCRGVESVPSVLSFEETVSKNRRNSFISPVQKEKYIGEIVITDPVVKKRAKENSSSYSKEFGFLFVHGFLHLMGYTHKQNIRANLMERQEDRIMNLLNNR